MFGGQARITPDRVLRDHDFVGQTLNRPKRLPHDPTFSCQTYLEFDTIHCYENLNH